MSERSGRTGVARDLTAFQQAILVVLADSPRYGLAIKRELEAYYGEGTNEYALTEDGVAAVEELVDWWLTRYVSDAERAAFVRERVDAAAQS